MAWGVFALVLPVAFSLVGCATVPAVQVYRPWQRVLARDAQMTPRSSFSISVEGESSGLIGDARLVNGELESHLSDLMARRGLVLGAPEPEFSAKLIYRTRSSERSEWASSLSSTSVSSGALMSSTGVAADGGGGLGLGVAIAQSVMAQAQRSATTVTSNGTTHTVHEHMLALEVRRRDGVLVWKGESSWESRNRDILGYAPSAIQLLLSGFPSEVGLRVPVPVLKSSAVDNYYRENCDPFSFACPGLPNPIWFNSYVGQVGAGALSSVGHSLGSEVESPTMLPAYRDLIMTAEIAVPSGSERDWENPVSADLWRRATIGGRYVAGPDRKPVNVIIELKGTPSSYVVDKAKVVSDEEYAEFESRLALWRKALSKYFDFYEH
jgi:hypothetical protein